MTNYRIFLLSFVTVSWVFLSGLNLAVDNDRLARENQENNVEFESFETEQTRQLMEKKQLKAKSNVKQAKLKVTSDKAPEHNNLIKDNGLEKPLDLSVPYQDSEIVDMIDEQKPAAQNRVTNIFAPETKKKPRSLELDSDFFMFPEPEAEKQKSVDGAGIVIKIKR